MRHSLAPTRVLNPAGFAPLVALLALAPLVRANPISLDDPRSPIRAEFDPASAAITVTIKATQTIWVSRNPENDPLTISDSSQIDSRHLTVNAAAKEGLKLRIDLELIPATGDLVLTYGGDPSQNLGRGIRFPYAFFPTDGSGFAVMPLFGGYVVPTSQIHWKAPWSHSRMEWFGGVDKNYEQGWMCIAEPAADMQLVTATTTVAGQPRLGGVFHWLGSNAGPGGQPDRLAYGRKAIIHFFTSGGYVAQAKRFRQYAVGQGWFKSLREKAAANPEIERLVGAPVIYLWGDGRSTAMLDRLQSAGLKKALIQLSINHVDPSGSFPNQEFADGDGWSKAVRARGFIPGIYDIYAVNRGARGDPAGVARPGQTGARYNGFSYLWPAGSAPGWNYVAAPGAEEGRDRPTISHQMSAQFALETRLPSHIRQFGLDAFFFDTVCALDPREDYAPGHFATRAQDIANRVALLKVSAEHFNKITGTEQIKSWGVPYVDWTEGMFKLGSWNSPGQVGAWNDNVYPQVMVDVMDPGKSLPEVLNTGFQVPLWELVYHDALLSVQHWHLVHNKLLYCWDFADLSALIRGQAPILNLVDEGAKGGARRVPGEAVDARDGSRWDTRMANPLVARHVAQTYETVSKWEGQVGYLEMINHRLLTADYSVQASEFSSDGGTTGRGIVINFGSFDGAHGMAGPTWTGEIRGKTVSVPVNGHYEYQW